MKVTKHIDYNDRIEIKKALKEKKSFKEIGRLLNKDTNNVRNEIKKFSKKYNKITPGIVFNNCFYKSGCPKLNGCKSCSEQNHCEFYVKVECDLVNKPPYCCNSCSNNRVYYY